MIEDRFYLVDPKSETHAIIKEHFAMRRRAENARWYFMNREFPESKGKKSGWKIVFWESAFGGFARWAIVPPAGVEMPADWKFDRKSDSWSPRHSTKRGKELHKEMAEDKYRTPTASDIGKAVGSPSTWVNGGFCTLGIHPCPNGQYILNLAKQHKIPKGVDRISDIRAEELLDKPAKKSAKKPSRAKKATA